MTSRDRIRCVPMRTSIFPGPELVEDPRLIRFRAEPRHHLHPYREVAVALPKGVPVLLGEDRGRAEDERLATVQRRRERGTNGDLGLPEADVSADEPVHRPGGLEVLLHGLDRLQLVDGNELSRRSSQSLERSSA